MHRVFLCVTIDCECDKGAGWRSQRPLRFQGISDGIGRRLQPLFAAHGAKPTYLLSPEVLRDDASVSLLAALEGSADLGSHLHGEYAEPGAFEPDVTSVFQREYSREVETAKLTYLTDLFSRAFGRRPRSFRAGRFGIGEHSLGILESLQYTVESSVTPHMDWSASGARGLSFVGAPGQPYHPDPKAPARPGTSPILEVPVTIRPHRLSRVPLLGSKLEPRWLRPTRGTGTRLVAVAREEIQEGHEAHPDRPVILNAMFHNVEVIPAGSPYAATEKEAKRILDRLGALLAFARREGIPVVGLGDIAEIVA